MGVRPRIRPLPRWRLRARRAGPAVALLAALMIGTGSGYAVAARVEDDWRPVSHVPVTQHEAAVVVRPSAQRLGPLIQRLSAAGLHVTLALPKPPAPRAAAMASAAGVEIVPALRAGLHYFRPSANARAEPTGEGDPDVPYVAPDKGFTFGEYLLGRIRDGHPVRPLRENAGSVRPGDVVEASGWRDVAQLDWRLGHRGIRVTSLGALLRDSSSASR